MKTSAAFIQTIMNETGTPGGAACCHDFHMKLLSLDIQGDPLRVPSHAWHTEPIWALWRWDGPNETPGCLDTSVSSQTSDEGTHAMLRGKDHSLFRQGLEYPGWP